MNRQEFHARYETNKLLLASDRLEQMIFTTVWEPGQKLHSTNKNKTPRYNIHLLKKLMNRQEFHAQDETNKLLLASDGLEQMIYHCLRTRTETSLN